jgi:hypothetical protein
MSHNPIIKLTNNVTGNMLLFADGMVILQENLVTSRKACMNYEY